jgi:hypothetical protein
MTERDEYGEYELDAGSPTPVDPDDVPYEPCNAVLKHTWSRYGERRYCTGMAIGNFDADRTDYEHPQFCKHHQARATLMERPAEEYTTGAHAKSHSHAFNAMPPHKKIVANDLYTGLIAESRFDFDLEDTEYRIDVSDSEFAGDVDTLVMTVPQPTDDEDRSMRVMALWFAALDFITMQSIREEQLRVAAEETAPDGSPLAIGERVEVVAVGEQGPVRDRAEHHLNLPLSRLQKDYSEHLQFGGVTEDDDGDDVTEHEWVISVEPDESAPQPESGASDAPFAGEAPSIDTPADG